MDHRSRSLPRSRRERKSTKSQSTANISYLDLFFVTRMHLFFIRRSFFSVHIAVQFTNNKSLVLQYILWDFFRILAILTQLTLFWQNTVARFFLLRSKLCFLLPKMLINCQVCICSPSQSRRYSQAKVSVASHRSQHYLVVIRAKKNDKFLLVKANVNLMANSFVFQQPNVYVLLKEFNVNKFQIFKCLIERILRKPDQVPPLPPVEKVLKNTISPISYSTTGAGLDPKKLSNQDLKVLQLYEVKKIPSLVWRLKSLTTLTLSACNLVKIPHSLQRFSETLVHLSLESNKIRELPKWFCVEMRKLVTLNMSRNHCQRIPFEIYLIQTLKSINFSHNFLTTLPQSLVFRIELYNEVNISHNLLSFLPFNKSTPSLTRKVIVNLSDNKFAHQPGSNHFIEERFQNGKQTSLFRICMDFCISQMNLFQTSHHYSSISEPIYDYFQSLVFVCSSCGKLRINLGSTKVSYVNDSRNAPFSFIIDDYPPVSVIRILQLKCAQCSPPIPEPL